MGNFEKLSVLVIVVIIVMILVVALYTWTGDPSGGETAAASVPTNSTAEIARVDLSQPVKDKVFSGKDVKAEVKGNRTDGMTDAERLVAEMLKDRRSKDGSLEGGKGSDVGEPGPIADTPKPEAPKEPRVHVVASGETIGKIARLEYPGVGSQRVIDAILKANPTVEASRLAIGYKLVLPELGSDVKPLAVNDASRKSNPSIEAPLATIKPGSIYVTRKGDTLPGISKRAYRDSNQWHRIWVENFDEITDTDHLASGMRLRIPVLDR